MSEQIYKKAVTGKFKGKPPNGYYLTENLKIPGGKGGYGRRIKISTSHPCIVGIIDMAQDVAPFQYYVERVLIDAFPYKIKSNSELMFAVRPLTEFEGEGTIAIEIEWMWGRTR